jgi:hypothetical protein
VHDAEAAGICTLHATRNKTVRSSPGCESYVGRPAHRRSSYWTLSTYTTQSARPAIMGAIAAPAAAHTHGGTNRTSEIATDYSLGMRSAEKREAFQR